MKVVLLCPELFAGEGGIARMLRLYLRALNEDPSTHSVVVGALKDACLPADRLAPYTPRGQVSGFVAGRNRLTFAWKVVQAARGAHRLVCGHVHLLPIARFARSLNPRLAISLVAHGIEIDRPLGPVLRWGLRGADRIWCVSQDTRTRLLAHHPDLSPDRIRVVPNALDPALDPGEISPPAESLAPGDTVILCVSRLDPREPYKGVELLLRAFALVHQEEPAVRLRIVGEGQDRTRLQQVARDLGLDTCVHFTGALSDRALQVEFKACRLFALPSSREGFGLVYLEAMAHGKPCVGVRAGGVPELVDAETGLLAAPDDLPGLASALLAALRRTWDPQRIRARARQYSYTAFRQRLAQAC